MKRILFVCKHNIFRSRVAEEYFNKTNKNKNWKADSAGVIPGDGLSRKQEKAMSLQRESAMKIGIRIERKPRGLSTGLLRMQDIIVIAADDVPKILFNNRCYIKKLICWKIKDADNTDKKAIEKTIDLIIKKVNESRERLK